MSGESKTPSLFDFVALITQEKVNKNPMLTGDDKAIKAYSPYAINKALSMGEDTFTSAQYANVLAQGLTDKRMHFDFCFYFNPRKYKRFNSWAKELKTDDQLKTLCWYYECNIHEARQYLDLLNEEQLSYINKRHNIYLGKRDARK